MKFTILVNLHYYILGLSDQCLGIEKIFKEIQQFYTFTPLDEGHENYIFQSLLTQRYYRPNLVKIGPVYLEKKMLTQDGRHPIAIGHLSETGDQIKVVANFKWGVDIFTLSIVIAPQSGKLDYDCIEYGSPETSYLIKSS